MNIAARILTFLYDGIRPLFGPATCKFAISCGEYTKDTLRTKPVYQAIPMIVMRVVRCNPFTKSPY